MSTEQDTTYFLDASGGPLGDTVGILPVTLYKGMKMTMHGHSGRFTVVDWNYHHGHVDEESALRIILQRSE